MFSNMKNDVVTFVYLYDLSTRDAPDKLSIWPDGWFSEYPISGRIFLSIRPHSRILKVAFFGYLFFLTSFKCRSQSHKYQGNWMLVP